MRTVQFNGDTGGTGYFNLKGLKEQRAKVLRAAEAIQATAKAEGRELTTQEKRNFDAKYQEFMNLTQQIENKSGERENVGQHIGALLEGLGSPATRKPDVWTSTDGKELKVYSKDQKMAEGPADHRLGDLLRGMVTGGGTPDIRNALAAGSSADGGFTVPHHTLAEFFDLFRSKSRVQQAGARILTLDTNETTIARVASDPTAEWKEENAVQGETDITFEGVKFEPKTLRFIVKASRELMADSVNMSQVLESVFAGVTASAVDAGILFGTGSDGQIRGLTDYDIAEHDMGTDGAELVNYDPLVRAYRLMLDNNSVGPNAAIMAPRTWESLAILKDSQNRYLDRPQALENVQFLESTTIPATEIHGSATNASRIIMGNWADLVIGMRQQMRIEVLRERFASNYQLGFLCHLRVDAVPARLQSFAQITGIVPNGAS